nr:glycosyltransferase family 2 protein [Gluconobacter cerevisiae]
MGAASFGCEKQLERYVKTFPPTDVRKILLISGKNVICQNYIFSSNSNKASVVQKEKSAIVIFVKDEAHDIMAWLSWHISLGFKKIFVYDDHSTDGTYEIAKSCEDIYNVEVFRTSMKEGNFYYRQRDSYFDAIQRASGHYEWIAMLDGDEYISIEGSNNINDFLEKFTENDTAIALSWCIYGSSSRVLKDKVPTYQAFNYRSTADLDDNTLVKSFVRPEAVNFSYENPHKYNLHYGNYADSLGRPVQWRSGATKDIVWEGARVNHYICRSMEHYIGRIKRRLGSDLSNSTVYWSHFDRNDVYDPQDQMQINLANDVYKNIQRNIFKFSLKTFLINGNYSDDLLNSSIKPENIDIFYLKSSHGSYLSINNIDGHLVQGEGYEKIMVAILQDSNKILIFRSPFVYSSNIRFHINLSAQTSYCYEFDFEYSGDRIYIKSQKTGKYLTAIPENQGGSVEFSREHAAGWEMFSIAEKVGEFTFFGKKNYSSSDLIYYMLNSGGNFSYEEFILKLSTFNTSDTINMCNLLGVQIMAII